MGVGSSEMAQQEKVPATKLEDLSSIPRTHVVGENQLEQAGLWPPLLLTVSSKFIYFSVSPLKL